MTISYPENVRFADLEAQIGINGRFVDAVTRLVDNHIRYSATVLSKDQSVQLSIRLLHQETGYSTELPLGLVWVMPNPASTADENADMLGSRMRSKPFQYKPLTTVGKWKTVLEDWIQEERSAQRRLIYFSISGTTLEFMVKGPHATADDGCLYIYEYESVYYFARHELRRVINHLCGTAQTQQSDESRCRYPIRPITTQDRNVTHIFRGQEQPRIILTPLSYLMEELVAGITETAAKAVLHHPDLRVLRSRAAAATGAVDRSRNSQQLGKRSRNLALDHGRGVARRPPQFSLPRGNWQD